MQSSQRCFQSEVEMSGTDNLIKALLVSNKCAHAAVESDAYSCKRCLHPCGRPPIVLPFYHSGMGRVMPQGSLVPRFGKTVHVTVGKPVGLADLLPRCNCERYEQEQVCTTDL